jgi:hypothetical protein
MQKWNSRVDSGLNRLNTGESTWGIGGESSSSSNERKGNGELHDRFDSIIALTKK